MMCPLRKTSKEPNMCISSHSLWSRWWSFTNETSKISRENFTIFFTTFSVLVWLIWTTKKPRKLSPPLPPGPPGLPLVGNLPFLGINLHHTFMDLARVYGPIFKLRFGAKLVIVISSSEIVKQVVRDNDAIFSYRDPSIATIPPTFGLNDIAMSQYGPVWKKLRKIFVREMLTNANLDNCFSLAKGEIAKGVAKVFDKVGTPIDVGEMGFSVAVNSVISMLLGSKKGVELEDKAGMDMRTKFREASLKHMEIVGKPNISDFFPLLARFDIQGIERQSKKNTEVFDMILSAVIEQELIMTRKNRLTGEKSKGFLPFLLGLAENEDTEESITKNQVKGMLLDVMLGGTDTTSTTIEWMMAELIQNPKAMKKVQDELTDVVGLNNVVEDFHLPKLHYLSAAIKEAMRLHPALPLLLPRCSTQSSTVGGYTIPEGSQVFLNVWALQRDPKFWDNPLEYRPERFLDFSKNFDFSGNNFVFLPFGSGRRVCAGLPLAERMLMYILATFLHGFGWKLPDGVELSFEDKFGITVKKLEPLIAIPTPRLSKLELYCPN